MPGAPWIDIVNVTDGPEAFALRGVLEYWGLRVALHNIATAGDLVRTLGGEEPLTDHVVVMCHGDANGLVLPELAPEVAAEQPFNGSMSPAQLRGFARLDGRLVLNTGCSLGSPSFAAACLERGCRAYIGPDGNPHGSASLLCAIQLHYELFIHDRSVAEAHERAAAHDADTALFRLYQQAP